MMRVIILLLFFSNTFLFAQEKIKFLNLNTSDGLSQNWVKDIEEDYLGFIWFATADGLNRYDGYNFKIYKKELNITADFYQIDVILESSDSIIWIGIKNGGLCWYDRKLDTFYQYKDRDGYTLEGKSVTKIIDDNKGNLIIFYDDGKIVLLDTYKQIFYWDFLKLLAIENRFQAITTNDQGKVWLGTYKGVVFEITSDKEVYYKVNKQYNILSHIKKLRYNNDAVWIASENGIFKIESQKLFYEVELTNRLETDLISDLITDKEDLFWIGTSILGLYRLNSETGELIDFKERGKNQRIIGNGISCIFCDKNNNIWIGTYSSGVNLFSRERHKFKEYMLIDGDTNPFKGTNVPSFSLSNDSSIWIANGGEISILKNGIISHYSETTFDSLQVLDKKVNYIYEDKSRNLWLGTRIDGLKYYVKGEGLHAIKALENILVNDILETLNGSFFIAHDGGLKEVAPDLGVKELAELHPDLRIGVNAVEKDLNGDILIGTNANGFFRYNENQNKLNKITGEGINKNIIINDILIDNKDRIWLATSGIGLLLYDRDEHLLKMVNFDIELLSKNIKAIETDNLGRLWFSTSMGISCYEHENQKLYNFSVDDGLQGDEFISKSSSKDFTGKILFGGFDGFNYFDPLQFQKIKLQNDVFVSEITFLHEKSKKAAIHRDEDGIIDKIELPYFLHDFTISLASRHFAYKERPDYWYKLQGYKEDWIHITKNNQITFTNLDPGIYNLIIDPSKLPSNASKADILTIKITPPIWQTDIAYISYLIIAITIIFMFRKKTLANQRLKADIKMKDIEAEKVRELNKLRSGFFTNVSHEFRTPITLLLGPLESLMKSSRGDEKLIYKYKLMHKNAKVLLRLINQILDTSKIEFGYMPLHITKGNIIEHIRDIFSSFEFLAETHQIKYTFECNFHNLRAYFDKDKIEKITYNLLSNAFKFTKDNGSISLLLNLIPSKNKRGYADRLILTVKDNGMGISKENITLIFSSFYQGEQLPKRDHIGTGIGLSLTKQLVNLHKGKISVESQLGEGSVFSVEIPLDKAKYEDLIEENYVVNSDRNLNMEFEDADMPEGISALSYENYDQVLIIDDNIDIIDYLNIELGNRYKIYQANDGKAGFDVAIRNIPDLIITDIMMPGLNGYELCGKLKDDPRTNHIPIIIITALSESRDKIKGLEIGADDYITKPFNMAVLQQKIENIISMRSRLKKLYNVDEDIHKKIRYEDPFIQKVANVIEANIQDPNLSVESLAEILNITSMQLYRKIRGALNQSPNEFIRFTRLNQAALFLRSHDNKNVTEVSFEVGFKDPSYFSRCFKKQFAISPKDFVSVTSRKY